MSRNRLLLIVLILILVAVAVAAFVLTQNQPAGQANNNGDGVAVVEDVEPTPEPQPTIPVVEVVIAIQDIPRGSRIIPDAVRRIEFLEPYAPFNALQSEEAVIGQIARTDIFREQIITDNLIVPNLSEIANVGSDAAAILPTNRVAVAVPIDRLSSVGYAMQPGDRVDVITSFLFVDVNEDTQVMGPNPKHLITVTLVEEEGGGGGLEVVVSPEGIRGEFDTFLTDRGAVPYIEGMSEEQRPRLSTQRTVQDALVIHVGEHPSDGRLFGSAPTPTDASEVEEEVPTEEVELDEDGEPIATPLPPRPNIVTLAVAPQDAVVLAWMVEARTPMYFALRSASSTSRVNTDPVTMDYIINRFNIRIPDRFSYALEPAITTVRQLQDDSRVDLSVRPAAQPGQGQ